MIRKIVDYRSRPHPFYALRLQFPHLCITSTSREKLSRQKTKESEKKKMTCSDLWFVPPALLFPWTGTQKMISRVSAAVERSWHTKQCKGSCQPVLCPHHPTLTLPTPHTCIPPFYERNKIINCTCNLFVIDQLVLLMAISFLPPFAPPFNLLVFLV